MEPGTRLNFHKGGSTRGVPPGCGTRYPNALPPRWFHQGVEPGIRVNFHRGGSTRVWTQFFRLVYLIQGNFHKGGSPERVPPRGFHQGVEPGTRLNFHRGLEAKFHRAVEVLLLARTRYYFYYYYYYIHATYSRCYFVSMCSSSSLSLFTCS